MEKMAELKHSLYLSQLKATLKRNLLLKKRDKRKTIAEVLLPLYSLAILIVIKITMPNPNLPEMDTPRGEEELLHSFGKVESHTVAVVPNTSEVVYFLEQIDNLWSMVSDKNASRINWMLYATEKDLMSEYWHRPNTVPIAVLFDNEDPLNGPLRYEIRTNPSIIGTPPTSILYSSPLACRDTNNKWYSYARVIPAMEGGDSCPVNQYYFSGFLALQALIDYTRIRIDTNADLKVPKLLLEMLPKPAHTGNWMFLIRIVIPIYMVMALSQFIAYLLILIVGEKEKKIKEGMKIMGLKDSVFWLSWFIIYGIFVLFLSVVCVVLLYSLKVFTNTNFLLIFILIVLYCFSIIMFGFMITPFFDKSGTAGILSNFIVIIMSMFYFVQVFLKDSNPLVLWFLSLISPSGFALAIDNAIVMDLSGEGVNIGNIWSGPGVPFGGSVIMMALDIILYGLLAYYLDSILPSEYGVKRSPLFCFKLSFWCSKKVVEKIPLANGESSEHSLNNTDYTLDVEPVPREMRGREAIKIVDLYKTFTHCQKPEVKAVNGINLTIYEGHITAILGHNGAGKTTLFNILTGLTAPTSGTAYIFGNDVRDPDDMDRIRRMTGVCPQHDILFDNLSPKEHLEFFAAVKGIHPSLIEFEVTKTLRDIDLTDKANSSSKHLSGGQKRKLSIGIAIIGDPKIIILDEPTAGVDPYSRRHMWSVLQNKRHGRVILLTTHFMDEADILADRKAVVSKGSIRCCGSSLFLKNKFGIGYHLTLVLEGHSKEHSIAKLVTTHVPKAEKARRHGRELSFILPYNAVSNFALLFSAIEQEINNKSSKLGISSYGVSMTTLEEVFLHLERDEEAEEDTVDNLSKKIVRNRALSRSLSLQNKSTSYQSLQNESNNALIPDAKEYVPRRRKKGAGDFGESDSSAPIKGIGLDSVECRPNWFQSLLALLRLRILRLRRDIKKLYFMIFLPLGLAILGLFINSMETGQIKTRSLTLNMTTYPRLPIAIYNGSDENLDDFLVELLNLGASSLDEYNGNFSSLLKIAPHMLAINVNDYLYPDYSITVLYNDTEQHSLPIAVNLINNAFYRLMTSPASLKSGDWNPMEVRAQPFQQTSRDFSVGMGTATFTMGMIFALIPVTLATDMVYDREIKGKNQLRVNGLSFSLYFISYFIVLAALMAFMCAVLLLIVLLFKTPSLSSWPALTTIGILVLVYCPSSILFSTCVSYIFDKTESAQSIMSNVATLIGWVPFIMVMILDGSASFTIHVVMSLLNTMYIPYAIIYFVQRVDLACKSNFGCTELTLYNYMTTEIVVMFVGLILHVPFWFFILLIVDIKKNGGRVKDIFKFKKNESDGLIEDANEASDIGENEDQDVKAERQKVKNLMRNHIMNPPVVMVENLHKEYTNKDTRCTCCMCCKSEEEVETTKTAVKSLSLAVDAGEVFGLLGHNGAGKTTTMKIITAEEAPTRGRVQIAGNSITSNMNSAFQLLGYCPQHDALWKNITVREHLEVYASIRGVPYNEISRLVNLYLSGLQIHEHADKQTDQCSGGTRRKLSFAMSMVGNPKIVLLDEPSTGMDPRSKRFLWDTVLASFQGSKGAILTTHSMEEADALCSRVGIMVKGELRCLGSTQHLKNLYGAGYTLEMKLGGGDLTPTSDAGDRNDELREFISSLFPDAALQESFADRLVFSVPQQSVPSLANCFKQLEKAKVELNIEEYSFSQTTLEQVFLKFAHEDENEE